jgi:WD40 repeat protein
VHDVAWRSGPELKLAVAHEHGVCVWHRIEARRSPALHSQLSARGVGNDWLPTLLTWPAGACATSVAWHPRGTLLAAASVHDGAVSVWDPLRPRMPPQRCLLGAAAGAHVLRWSPSGQLLFCGAHQTSRAEPHPVMCVCSCPLTARFVSGCSTPECYSQCIAPKFGCYGAGCTNGTFRVFETLSWRSQSWSHRASGFLVDAAWSATAAPPALILVCSRQIFSLHFTEPPPALHAQLLPLAAPQVYDGGHEVSSSGGGGSGGGQRAPDRGVRCACLN